MTPLVSVLLPYRNAAETIEEALASVLADAGERVEIVAVDDGSTDEGPARVAEMQRRDARVVTLATGGAGIAGALSQGLARARGAFIARMDGDDVSLPGRFDKQLAALAGDPRAGAVGTRVQAFPEGAAGEGMLRYIAWQNALVSPEDHARELFVESPLCHPSVMLRREALEGAGGWREGPWPEDYDLWLRLDARGWRLAKVPEVLLLWRHRPGRATFTDPRYALERFTEAKAHYLAPRLRAAALPAAVWGAGKTGRRMARALSRSGVTPQLFVDIDPRKIGRTAQGAPIVAPSELERGRHVVVVAVGARGARALIRAHLDAHGFEEGADYVCAA